MEKTFYNMSIPELQNQLQQKEFEYREAIKAKKVFWEVRKIREQKKVIERELIKKKG